METGEVGLKHLARILALFLMLVMIGGPAVPGPAQDQDPSLTIHEWEVPWENTRPRDPYVGPDETVWFVGQVGNYLARLDPETGEMERFELPEGTMPHNVIVDEDGFPWFAGNRAAYIGRLDPATGEIDRYEMPEGVNDPHTMVWGSEGGLWFTAQRSRPSGYIGRLEPDSGDVEVIEVPGQNYRPYGIVTDSTGRPWIAFMGTNAIGTVDPDTMDLELIETPNENSRIRRLGVTSDDRIWWVDYARGYFGVYDPAEGTMDQWRAPAGEDAGLYAAAVDGQDRFWFVETRRDPNRFVGFDTRTEEIVTTAEVPSGGGTVRHMVFHSGTGALWFGTDENTVGRAVVP